MVALPRSWGWPGLAGCASRRTGTPHPRARALQPGWNLSALSTPRPPPPSPHPLSNSPPGPAPPRLLPCFLFLAAKLSPPPTPPLGPRPGFGLAGAHRRCGGANMAVHGRALSPRAPVRGTESCRGDGPALRASARGCCCRPRGCRTCHNFPSSHTRADLGGGGGAGRSRQVNPMAPRHLLVKDPRAFPR